MRLRTILSLAVLGAAICVGTKPLIAQEAASAAKPPDKPAVAYRLDFSINELQDGKKINSRHYSITQTEDSNIVGLPGFKDLKIGTRVPVESGANQFQYIDIGTNISSRLYMKANTLTLDVHADLSNLPAPDPNAKVSQPLIRQIVISGSMILTPGKPMIVGSVDDPNSNREFQLEVTATKL
jgi:hypothetical protein